MNDDDDGGIPVIKQVIKADERQEPTQEASPRFFSRELLLHFTRACTCSSG